MNPKSVLVSLFMLLTWTLQVHPAPASSGSAAISVRFVGNGVPMAPAEIAGVIAKSNWNNANGSAMNSPLALADEFGNASGATIVWQADNLHALPISDQPGNVRMMTGYLDTHFLDATKVTVSGLAANSAGYNVYVYVDGDNGSATRSATYQISGAGITTTSIPQTDPANSNFSGAFTQANNSNGNYVVFSINSSGFTLLAIPGPASDGIQRAPLNGIQIVPAGQTSNPDFTLSSAPNSSSVNSGSSTTSTVSIGAINGFSGSVNLSVGGLPTGATASLSPAAVTPGVSSTLTVSTGPNTPAGSSMLSITGASTSLTHTIGLALTVNSAGATSGKTISIKFSGTGTAMASTEVAGVVPQSNWNNEGWVSGTSTSLFDQTGVVSGATVSWKADGLHALPIVDQPGNARMMRGYLDGIANATTVTVSGLPANANGYSVYVYADGDNGTASRAAIYQISGPGITTTSVSLTDATNTNFSGTLTQASNSAGDYVVFGINATTFTISATASAASDGTPRAPLNGMQIVAIAASAPSNLTTTVASASQVNLSWSASVGTVAVTGYDVERCSGAGCSNFAQIAAPTGTTFNDTGLTASTSYSYRVRANDAAGNNSSYSNTANATTSAAPPDTTPPGAPANLSTTAASTSQINLTWTASTDNAGVAGYKVERCSGSGCANFAQIAAPTGTSFNDMGLTASTSYSYRVRANDAAGNNSPYSNTASATTQASSGNVSVTISPKRGGLTISQTMPFTATLTNDVGSAGVTWSASSGTFNTQSTSAATYVAPNSAGVVTVTATSVADVTKSASATIGVTDLTGVFTYHNDLSRDGVNAQEYALTTANVATATFGKLFSCAADAAIYAQPLWAANLNIQSGTHNVVFAATVHDTVYAFDADTNPCVKYWSVSLLGSSETWLTSSDVGTGDIAPEVGIIGTPVIDQASNTLYVVSKSKNTGSNCTPAASCHQRLHALSLIDGSEKFGGPVDITSAISVAGTGDGSSGGNVAFNTLRQNQRPGLVLSKGLVYVAWASHGDNGPYHGWVIGFDKTTLARVATFNANPNGSESGIWMGGGAPAADSSGNLYFLTGNGTFDVNSGGSDYGDSTVKLSTSGGLSVAGYFTPADQQNLEGGDTDHGSGGAAILVDQASGAPHQHLVIGGGKEGNFFLLDRDNLGGYGANFNPADSNAVQKFSEGNAIFSTAAFFNNALYIAGAGANLKSFAFNTATGQFNAAQTSQSAGSFGFPGATPSVSALGTTNGILWAMDNGQYCTAQSPGCGAAVLHAFDATQLSTELWNSSQTAGDKAGNAVKFTVPTVGNGKVYIGTRGNDTGNGGTTIPGEIDVYGLKPN